MKQYPDGLTYETYDGGRITKATLAGTELNVLQTVVRLCEDSDFCACFDLEDILLRGRLGLDAGVVGHGDDRCHAEAERAHEGRGDDGCHLLSVLPVDASCHTSFSFREEQIIASYWA